MTFENFIFSNPITIASLFIIAYAILGSGIKYIDAAFDENAFSRNKAILLAPILGILWALTMLLSVESATILLAVFLSVLLAGEIDNTAFQLGSLTIVLVILFSGFFEFLWLPLIFITLAGVVDEVGNDVVDKKKIDNKFIHHFFKHRFAMKLAVFFFALFNYFGWIYLFAFMAFDIAYELVGAYSIRKHKQQLQQCSPIP